MQVRFYSYNFNPRSPHGERLFSTLRKSSRFLFQSTLPARGATIWKYHHTVTFLAFQSTLPARGATPDEPRQVRRVNHFNPRSPHGERPHDCYSTGLIVPISIHAPRTGSDSKGIMPSQSPKNFNPRSPHGERRMGYSIRSARVGNFNPRSPHGERHAGDIVEWGGADISIHAPRTGSDKRRRKSSVCSSISIHAPRTGSDACTLCDADVRIISIHAPRTGSDRSGHSPTMTGLYFNPRSPHGERPPACALPCSPCPFQSTLPARGATRMLMSRMRFSMNFNPRSPHGERRELCGLADW